MSDINVENEKEISVNLTRKGCNLTSSCGCLFIGFSLIISFLFKLFTGLELFLTIFCSILVGCILLSILFSSLANFICYNFRDNKEKLFKNNKVRNLFLILSYSFLWGFIGLAFVFLMVLLILK